MSKHWIGRLGIVVAASATLSIGCAEEREPISRVQANALQKSFFVGEKLQDTSDDPEFWAQGTLVDVGGYGAAQDGLFTSTYAQPLSRIKWVITEDALIGRATYERIDDADGKGTGPASTDGTVAYIYPIVSHFDIKRAYNPSTGEELNVIEENTSDRAWYERSYMRVDWSRNLATDAYDFDTLSLLGVFGGVSYEPISYYVNDPEDGDAPYFDPKAGYFDVTNKAFAAPKQIDLSAFGWGIDKYPACFLPNDFMHGSWPAGSCNPVELTIRQSFRKVEETDFEPVDWDGYRFQAYGAFYVERSGYARNYGMSDTKWHRMINRYDLFERSHYYTSPETMEGHVACFTPETTGVGGNPHRDENQDGTEDECAAVTDATGIGGSRCDTFKQRCTLPYRLRTPKTITWYYTDGNNQEYFEPTHEATHEWDVALRSAIGSAQYAECVTTGGNAGDCSAQWPVYFGQQDDNVAAVRLANEVDACRASGGGDSCQGLADTKGAELGYAPGVIATAKMPEQLVLCHSPVEKADHPACAPEDKRLPEGLTAGACAALKDRVESDGHGSLSPEEQGTWTTCKNALHARRGDLRYHQVNVMTTPETPSPWGIYVDAEDPLTGEKVAASINVWSHVNDMFGQKVTDMMRYIKGELKTEDITDGTHIRDWAAASEAASRGGMAPRFNKEEVSKRVANFAGKKIEDVDFKGVKLDPSVVAQARKLKAEMQDVVASIGVATTSGPMYQARREMAQGSEVEAQLVTPMMQQYAGVAEMPADLAVDQASILRAANPQFQRDIRNLKETALAHRGACILHEAPAPMALTGLADIVEEKFGAFDVNQSPDEQFARAERIKQYIAKRAHYAVILHEMGHSIGLRHNFVSSSDAYNYRPQYWQLRTKNGTLQNECTGVTQDPATCVGPRFYDPMTEDERKNLIWTWMHSSVMDYAGELTQDMVGLGAYDFAAARMFYGDTVAVYDDPSYAVGTPRAKGLFGKMDNFGGILGMQPTIGDQDIHYSQIYKHYDVISNCRPVDPMIYRPSNWNEEAYGPWHPIIDGGFVQVDGGFSVCDQQKVQYVPWNALHTPNNQEHGLGFYRGGPAVDRSGRVRVPYGFATDGWADLGNASVYRHDNGADTYEIFDFLITQQEVFHIFDNYRRGRQDFSVRSAANRTLGRYNEKIRDGAKGLSLYVNIYKEFSAGVGWDFEAVWPYLANELFANNILASGVTFDHFVRTVSRPEPGGHYVTPEKVMRSAEDVYWQVNPVVTIPDGATGYLGEIGAGGKPLENKLSENNGEYDRDYTLNSGAYYDKVFASMLFTESVDNFISSSRTDFLDARYRSVSLADLFPEGYRRFLANALTGDDFIKGPRLSALPNGFPSTGADGYPSQPIGWTTWWTETPEACFAANGTTLCTSYGADGVPFNPQTPANVVALDPQIGWEQQKFLIAWTMMYLPENQKQNWINMMRMWELGKDSDPAFTANRIEFHHPNGKVFVARTFGKETIFGKEVERGIAARVLQYANELMNAAYVTTPVDHDTDGKADWYIATVNPTTGQAQVKFDPSVSNASGGFPVTPNCNATNNSGCTCSSNKACSTLEAYVTVPFYLRQALAAYGIVEPDQKGVY